MAWQGILGHDRIVEGFRTSLSRGRCAGSFLFIGPAGVGKRTFTYALGKAILCRTNGPLALDPCGECDSCRMFGPTEAPSSSHPDFHYVSKPADKSFLPLDLLIGDKEHRGRSGLCFEISRTPYMGGRRIAVIDDADFLNPEGTNSLLKTLEEPPADAIMILIGTNTARQLPTIRSRCRLIRFLPLSNIDLANILLEQGHVKSLEQGLRLAKISDGGIESALALLDESLDEIRDELSKELSTARPRSVFLAKRLNEFVEAAGKEAPPRRRRFRSVLKTALDIYRSRILDESTGPLLWSRRIDRTLEAMEQLDRNANIPFVLEAWLQDVGENE